MVVGKGSPGCKDPIGCITILIALKSCSKHHLPEFFLNNKMVYSMVYEMFLYVPLVIAPI
jgi:hypothetical protein